MDSHELSREVGVKIFLCKNLAMGMQPVYIKTCVVCLFQHNLLSLITMFCECMQFIVNMTVVMI